MLWDVELEPKPPPWQRLRRAGMALYRLIPTPLVGPLIILGIAGFLFGYGYLGMTQVMAEGARWDPRVSNIFDVLLFIFGGFLCSFMTVIVVGLVVMTVIKIVQFGYFLRGEICPWQL